MLFRWASSVTCQSVQNTKCWLHKDGSFGSQFYCFSCTRRAVFQRALYTPDKKQALYSFSNNSGFWQNTAFRPLRRSRWDPAFLSFIVLTATSNTSTVKIRKPSTFPMSIPARSGCVGKRSPYHITIMMMIIRIIKPFRNPTDKHLVRSPGLQTLAQWGAGNSCYGSTG